MIVMQCKTCSVSFVHRLINEIAPLDTMYLSGAGHCLLTTDLSIKHNVTKLFSLCHHVKHLIVFNVCAWIVFVRKSACLKLLPEG